MIGHVVLVGLMGSGKTTVGRRLAKRLGRPFVDADDALEERAGQSVADVFATKGEAGFRELEADVLAGLLATPEPAVVAAGGGAVVTPATRERLRAPELFVVWLTASPAFLASRLARKDQAHRPLLDTDPRATLERLLAEREAWYGEVADLVVDIEPVHRQHARPKAHLAEVLAASVLDAERA